MTMSMGTRVQHAALVRAVCVLRGDNLPGAACACGAARDAARRWLCDAHVQGFGVGEARQGGVRTGQLALRIYVDQKRPKCELAEPIPSTWEVPGSGDVPIDVVPIGTMVPEAHTATARPFMPGCSMAHRAYTYGTLGFIARDRGGGKTRYALSNAHVFAQVGHAAAGDAILQTSPGDGGKHPDQQVARLSRFVPIQFNASNFPNTVDAALAEIGDPSQIDHNIRLLGHRPMGVNTRLRRGMRVQKVGRTSGHTRGVIEDIHYHGTMGYPAPDGSGRILVADFRDLVLCSRFTEPGDSGSLVLSGTGKAVGLHMAGTANGSIFCKIGNVLDSLNIELDL